jgi:hypothetical protein
MRSDAADRDVQRMICEQKFSAARNLLQRKIFAACLEPLAFTAEVGMCLAFLRKRGGTQRHEREDVKDFSHAISLLGTG